MRPHPLAALLLVLLLALAACGTDDPGTDDPAADVTGDDVAGDGAAGGAAGSGDATSDAAAPTDTPTTADGEGKPALAEAPAPEIVPAAPGEVVDAGEIGWATTAIDFRGQDGTQVDFECPPGGEAGRVWGSEFYTDDSSVCTAGVHAGLITLESGGRVRIEIAPGQESYTGTEANGAITSDWPSWGGSFIFSRR